MVRAIPFDLSSDWEKLKSEGQRSCTRMVSCRQQYMGASTRSLTIPVFRLVPLAAGSSRCSAEA